MTDSDREAVYPNAMNLSKMAFIHEDGKVILVYKH